MTADMSEKDVLYEGKAKKLYPSDQPGELIMEFKDDATAFDGEKFNQFENKGRMNKEITLKLLSYLEDQGISTHLAGDQDSEAIRVREVDIFPVEVVVRNVVAGSLEDRIGRPEGEGLSSTLVEYFYKRDDLGDPMLAPAHIELLEIASEEQLETIRRKALNVNDHLRQLLEEAGIELVDFKLEFGHTTDGTDEILLADEITPDTCRLWDAETRKKLDKDRFRRDLGDVMDSYRDVLERINHVLPN